ncbi:MULTISPECIES: TVP38/TMEM64 family protein [unclassified Colwellia]|uniref:TVP38/TMEM64 family protein n=1 Tax=unclassified Colwellia TaxID=196834 RepID=UPI0015F75DF0|nr:MULTISPECIES: VTT domain-containing protein [unclassified Colwellia]MBA6365168.1 VTT domain-containing protein [Colwellia sp. BRX8-8]MBA6371995.1 VTT domain-containing protein [Colwellia sp. BRX8-4]MBA6377900.1 VTT domain-containing protein [Colwellia sp. BRX10-7]MBA6387634.1 VTT domain-containing protein [Colwellia sp. BRX10-2]MBA6400908.1 VTT domain-containing protein [Colwellia sp. BRX10-5]
MLSKQTKTLFLMTTLISIAILFSVLFSLDVLKNNNLQPLLDQFIPQGYLGVLMVLSLLALLTSIGLPRQVAAFSCGYIFGIVYGTLLATLAATLGCMLTLFIAKTFFRQRVLDAYPDKVMVLSAFFSTDTFSKALVIRLLPAGSNFLTNILAGMAKVKFIPYVTGTCVGFIPQMLIFSLLGAGIKVGEEQQILLSLSLLVVALIFGYLLYKKEKKHNKKGAI